MKDTKEQVWEGFRGELRRHRIHRRTAGSTLVLIALAAAVWWMIGLQPTPDPVSPRVVEVEAPASIETPQTSPQLAVFIHDAEGMRLEMVDAGAMTTAALSMSLEPVVWSGEAW